MVFGLFKAFLQILKRQIPVLCGWMMRGFAIGLGVALFRVIQGEILLPMGYSFDYSWNIVVAISFPLTWLAAEFWIWATRPKKS